MRAKLILSWAPSRGPQPHTPNLKLPCHYLFEGEDGATYYVPENYEYITKLGNRRSPATGAFIYNKHSGIECEIEFEDFSGDLIVTRIKLIPGTY
jgi:hypothetical protein